MSASRGPLAHTTGSTASALWAGAALLAAGVFVVGPGACLPPIPDIGRPCVEDADCRSGYYALLSSNMYCVASSGGAAVDGGAAGVCLLLQQEPDGGGLPDGGTLPDAGESDGGDGDGDGSDAGPIDCTDPYACESFAPFVRGVVVAREDGAVVRQPLSAFDLGAPADSWSVVETSRLGTAQIVGADLVFAPSAGSVGEGRLLLSSSETLDGPCADRVIAVDLRILRDSEWTELIPEAPEGCTATACGKVVLTEDNPNLLPGRSYESIAVVSGVSDVNVVGVAAGQDVLIEAFGFVGAPTSVHGVEALVVDDAPLGVSVVFEGHTPPVILSEGQELEVTGWLRTDYLTLGSPGGVADAELTVGPSAWVQSDATLLTSGPHTALVQGALVGKHGASLNLTDLIVEGSLIVGGSWRCASGAVSFSETGQVWVDGDARLDCPGVPLPDLWVFPGGRVRFGSALGITSFRTGARVHSRGRIDVCRWEQLETGAAAPPIVLDDGAELIVGTPLLADQHDALLEGCSVSDGASVSMSPLGACGDSDVVFPPVDRVGTRGVIVGCVGSDACPSSASLPSSELIGPPPGPYRPEIAEVVGGELSFRDEALSFTPGFVGQRGTANVLSCTGPTFGVDIDAASVDPGTWFWTGETSDDVSEPANWLDDEGKPTAAAPPSTSDTVLFVLPGPVAPRFDVPFTTGDLRVAGGGGVRLDAPLTVANTALASGRVTAGNNAGELVFTGLGVLPPDGQVAGRIMHLAITDASAPELTSALQVERLSLRAPDADGLTLFIEEDARIVVDSLLSIDDDNIALQLVGPGDGDATLTVNGTLDLGSADVFAMFNGTVIEVRGGLVCSTNFPTMAAFSGNERLRFIGDALQPLSCESPVGAVPPQILVAERARVQLDGREELGVGVTRVGEGVAATTTLTVNGELLFFGPDLLPQQLVGLDAIVVGPQGKLRFPPTDTGVDLLGGATCTASSGAFLAGQIEGFDDWCAP